MRSKNFPVYVAASKISGMGWFASRDIKVGEVVNIMTGKEYSEKQVDDLIRKGKLKIDDDFQIHDDKFLVGPGVDYFINHSCEPNAGVKNTNQIVAVKNIKKDEEVAIDYSTISGIPKNGSSYRNDEWTMICNCRSRNCRGNIGYVLSLPKKKLKKYIELGIVPDFIASQISS